MKDSGALRVLGAVALTTTLWCGVARADEPPPNIGTTIREIEQKRPTAPPKSDPSLKVERSRAAMSGAPETAFHVNSVRISGTTVFPDLELLPLVDNIAGHDVTLADLERAAARISDFYHANGYPVARAYIPAQTIDRGSVEIAVLEGRYGALDVRNSSKLSESLVTSTLKAPSGDAVIETAPLDRDLLLLKDLSGVAVDATLTPGERVGTSNLIVDIEPTQTFGGTLEADNYGNKYTGEARYGGSVTAANLTGRGDLATVRGLISEDTGLWYGRAAYLLPLTGGGLKLGLAASHTYYSLGQRFSVLNADGDANIYSASLQYPLVRSTRANLSVQSAFNYFDLEDDIGASNSVNPRSIRAGTIGVSGDIQDDWFGGAINAASLAFSRGDLSLDNNIAEQIDRATAETQGYYSTLIYSALRLQRITDALQMYVGVQGQYANKNLDSSQKFVLGGPNAVRAYPQGVAVGDEGFLGTVELRYALPAYRWFTHPQAIVFFDGGRVSVNKDPFLPTSNDIDLKGAGVGLNVDMPYGFALRGSVAWRIGSDSAVDSSDSSRAWIQLVKAF
ncbi:MAG TPA: ShlB/FhaC/HecB family hemolysin secretion/activation protein [Pseudomonadales bacterium]|nr:ShlB/FhaC/HecB family hemolysin secretion/activation protein [Pseudomonadales bacterium]